ncbi:acetyltransferase, partial [Micractinium conductrix]
MRSPFASTRVQPRRRAVRRAAAAVAAAMAALAAAFACMSALLPLLAMSGLPRAEAAVAEISPTIYLGGIGDLRRDGGGASKCEKQVDAAVSYGMFQRAQFLVSALWWDSGPAAPPPGWTGCKNYTLSTSPVTQGEVDEFTSLLTTCLKHAVSKGLSPAINVHIDDGRAENGWRNTLAFNPLQQFQGEMGATVFFFPKEWTQVAGMVRDRLRPDLQGRVKLGLGINNSKLCGCVLIDIVNYDEYLAAFAPLWPSMDIEFGYYGLTLKELYDSGKEIHWIEWGIGGGISQNGDTPAKTAIEAANYPYW